MGLTEKTVPRFPEIASAFPVLMGLLNIFPVFFSSSGNLISMPLFFVPALIGFLFQFQRVSACAPFLHRCLGLRVWRREEGERVPEGRGFGGCRDIIGSRVFRVVGKAGLRLGLVEPQCALSLILKTIIKNVQLTLFITVTAVHNSA